MGIRVVVPELVSDGDAISTAELMRRIAKRVEKNPRLLPVPEGEMKLVGKVRWWIGWLGLATVAVRVLSGWLNPQKGQNAFSVIQ